MIQSYISDNIIQCYRSSEGPLREGGKCVVKRGRERECVYNGRVIGASNRSVTEFEIKEYSISRHPVCAVFLTTAVEVGDWSRST